MWQPSGGGEKWFCVDCGSPVYARNVINPELLGIRMGTFDGDPGIRPTAHAFVDSAVQWEAIPEDGLPRYPGRRPPAT